MIAGKNSNFSVLVPKRDEISHERGPVAGERHSPRLLDERDTIRCIKAIQWIRIEHFKRGFAERSEDVLLSDERLCDFDGLVGSFGMICAQLLQISIQF